MFVLSFRRSRKKTIVVLAVLLVAVTLIGIFVCRNNAQPEAVSSGKKYALSAADNNARVAFFQQFGWKVDPEPIDTGDVTIPKKFDDVYVAYNNIQKEQGLDLQPYAGKTVRQWIYAVTNYPNQEAMRGTLLVCDGRVIGGDLCTPALDGFMTGFDGQKDDNKTNCDAPFEPARNSMGALTAFSPSSTPKTSSAVEAKRPASSNIPANAWPTD